MRLALIVFSLLALLFASPVHAVGAESKKQEKVKPLAQCAMPPMIANGAVVATAFQFNQVRDSVFAVITQGKAAGAGGSVSPGGNSENGNNIEIHTYNALAEVGDYLIRENLAFEAEAHDLNRAERLIINVLKNGLEMNIQPINTELSLAKRARVFAVVSEQKLPTTAIVQLQDAKGKVLEQFLAGTIFSSCH
jgi:hypothetical protein